MSVEFDIGRQVVCVRDDWKSDLRAGERFPYKGEILTIREILPPDVLSCLPADAICFRFVEIVNPVVRRIEEPAFDAYAFRPVRKTDISILEKLLVPIKDEVMA